MPAGRPRKLRQRIAPTDYDALLTRWLHGATVRELAAAYGVRYQTIQYHLKRAAKDCEAELVRTAQQRILELADLRALLWQRLETTDDGWQILALARGIMQLTLAEHSLAQALQPPQEEFRVAGKLPDQVHLEAAQRLARLIREHQPACPAGGRPGRRSGTGHQGAENL